MQYHNYYFELIRDACRSECIIIKTSTLLIFCNSYIITMSNLIICKQCNNNQVRKTNHLRWSACFIYKCVQCTSFWYVCELHNQRFASAKRCYMNNISINITRSTITLSKNKMHINNLRI